jgi:hypothetical protein
MRRRPRRPIAPALLAGIIAGISFAPPAGAQEVVEPPVYRSNRPYESEVEAAQPKESRFHLRGGIDYRDQYFFRGYNYASSGVILQPYFTALYTVYEDEHIAITPHVGAWFDLTEVKGPENPQHFNEFDAIAGVGVDCADFTFDFQWVLYKSPSERFQRSEEVGVDVIYHDRKLWPDSSPIAALNPSVAFFQQYYDKNDHERDSYVGFGLEPELHSFDVGRVPVTVSFPLTFGGSYDGYYFTDQGKTEQAGYWIAGVKAAFDLPRANDAPRWRVEAEIDYIRLMADSVERANGGDHDDVFFRIGLKFEM